MKRIGWVIVALVVVVMLAVPFLGRWVLADQIEAATGVATDIDGLWFNPLTGAVSVEGLTMRDESDVVLRITAFSLNVGVWGSLLGDITVDTIAVSDGVIQVDMTDTDLRIAGIDLGSDSSGTESAEDDEAVAIPPFFVHELMIDQLSFDVVAPQAARSLTIENLSLTNISLMPDDLAVSLALTSGDSEISLTGAVSVSGDIERPNVSADLALGLEEIDLALLTPFIPLAASGTVEARATVSARLPSMALADGSLIELSDISVLLADINVADTAMSADVAGSMSISELIVSDGNAVVIDEIDIAALSASYKILAQGVNDVEPPTSNPTANVEEESPPSAPEDLPATESDAEEEIGALAEVSEAEINSEASTISVSLSRLTLNGESLSFEDQSVDPPVNLVLLAPTMEVSGIAPGQAGEILFNATHGKEHQTLSLSGTVEPSLPDVDIKVTLSDFDLFTVGGYSGDRIRSGQFSIESGIKISGDALTSENQLNVRGLMMSDEGSGDAMPITAALSLLKDKDGSIDLAVPVEGQLDELSVDVNGILTKALSNAATRTAVTYAKFALQPFGGILLAKDLASGLNKPRLPDILFVADQSQLAPEMDQYLAKVADLMAKRPDMRLTLCPVYAPADVLAAETLSVARTEVVSIALTGAGVSTDRLVACQPTTSDSGEPRVELSL
ncbi:MAG: DUF748 domain-containing protein [Pseudomonadota bacterium]